VGVLAVVGRRPGGEGFLGPDWDGYPRALGAWWKTRWWMRDSRIHRYECVRGYMWMSIWCGVADGCKPFRRGYPSCDIVGLCQGPFLSVGLVYASTL